MRIWCPAFVLLFGCGETILVSNHRVEPAPEIRTTTHAARITRVAVGPVDEDRGREIARLWVELELREDGDVPWTLVARDLALARGTVRRTAEGFADEPRPRGDVDHEIVIAAHGSRRIWARFDQIALDDIVESPSGGHRDVAARLGLEVAGTPAAGLVEPARADPVWVQEESSRFSTLSTGFSEGVGRLGGAGSLATSMEVNLGVAQRISDADLGLVGLARFGNETILPQQGVNVGLGGMYVFVGGGPTMGYTLRTRNVRFHPSLAWVVGRAQHPGDVGDMTTTSHELVGELQVEQRARQVYPFVARDSALGWGAYVRVSATLGTMSGPSEPIMFLISFGLVGRAGG
jgi:hypothetical protein